MTDFKTFIEDKTTELSILLKKKNDDYSSTFLTPPSLAPYLSPDTAVLVRMSDKMKRLAHLLEEDSEGVSDTLMDIAGYSFLLLYLYSQSES